MHLRNLGLQTASTAELAVRAVDAAGNTGPAATAIVYIAGATAKPLPELAPAAVPRAAASTGLPRLGGREVAVIDELDKVDPIRGRFLPPQSDGYSRANHLWNAAERRISLHAARNEFVAFQIWIHGSSTGTTPDTAPELIWKTKAAAIQVSQGRYHLVPTPTGPLPDPIVPLGAALPQEIPNSVTGAQSQSLHVELYVPHDIPAGIHQGVLTLRSGRDSLPLALTLTVWDFTLPDHLSFLPEMNCYDLPENERDYYRLAHRHRTVLNRLPYHQNGRIQDGCAPGWDGARLDWRSWDRRFGPLLDGSAFADLSRKGVPLECLYLPLHENWPSPMEGNYSGSYWADQAFPGSYRRAFLSASRQIAEHFQARGWTETLFQGFLNNKNNFKAQGWSRGSSPWLLDEPANFQDYWALRYFARAFHEGVNQARRGRPDEALAAADRSFPRMVFRIDDSRPQWRRDALDGLVDYDVVGTAMRDYPRLVFDRKRRLGEIVVEYGSSNPVQGSNLQPVAWCLDAWSLGADEVLPWQTIGTAQSWQKADELALIYPLPGGEPGVVPSIRLKAYRRGQQDVEYLTLWAKTNGLTRAVIGSRVRELLHLAGSRHATEAGGPDDAGRIDDSGLRPQDVLTLRLAIGKALSDAHPAPEARLVDFRTLARDPYSAGLEWLGRP
jgi:hypothetical protein